MGRVNAFFAEFQQYPEPRQCGIWPCFRSPSNRGAPARLPRCSPPGVPDPAWHTPLERGTVRPQDLDHWAWGIFLARAPILPGRPRPALFILRWFLAWKRQERRDRSGPSMAKEKNIWQTL